MSKNKKQILIIAAVLLLCVSLAALYFNAKTSKQQGTEAGEPATNSADVSNEADKDYNIDYLILVNKEQLLPSDWEENLKLVKEVNSVGDEVSVEAKTYEAYLKLKEALEKEGIHVEMDSAYRSVAEQQQIIDDFTEKYGAEYVESYVAPPGTTEHHTGLAIDLYLIVDGKTVYENEDLVKYPEIWAKIHEKLPEYGFILRYPKENNDTGYEYEEWHIRYVGEEVAKEITEKGITLDRYLAQ